MPEAGSVTYVGVDACSSGWFAGINSDCNLRTARYDRFRTILKEFPDAEQLLVDIPIVLPASERRECDVEAKTKLGCRGASVFYPPCQAVLEQDDLDYAEANELNREELGNGLSQQAYHILPKTREVARSLKAVGETDHVVESHPELCFYAFNRQHPIAYSKQSDLGQSKRREVLRSVLDEADTAYENAVAEYYRKDVARDDILDALVLTAAARQDLTSLPNGSGIDETPVIAYPVPDQDI